MHDLLLPCTQAYPADQIWGRLVTTPDPAGLHAYVLSSTGVARTLRYCNRSGPALVNRRRCDRMGRDAVGRMEMRSRGRRCDLTGRREGVVEKLIFREALQLRVAVHFGMAYQAQQQL